MVANPDSPDEEAIHLSFDMVDLQHLQISRLHHAMLAKGLQRV